MALANDAHGFSLARMFEQPKFLRLLADLILVPAQRWPPGWCHPSGKRKPLTQPAFYSVHELGQAF
jgi:hypothetical protein